LLLQLRLVEQQLDCQRLQQELKAGMWNHRQQEQQQLASRSCRCQRCLFC
jgi:hypothetical protein